MNRRLYALHRWVSALAFLQLGVWTLTGSFFALVPIERVRGAGLEGAHDAPLALTQVVPPADLKRGARPPPARALTLQARPQGVFYVLRYADGRAERFDARTGERAPVTAEEARSTARRDQPRQSAVRSCTWLTRSPGPELRGKALPVWRVALEDGQGTVIYVDGTTGEVVARRNDLWRWYDLLWALHIMDYEERESFNHPLLAGAALLSVSTVASGLLLWAVRLMRRFRRPAR